ncbi:hypothetical protein JHK84_048383 [Glycine max]|nr:hypothetical protein JHK84_048383 [Glycine max]
MMHMTLYWGKKVTILIDSWKTDSWTSYVLSLLACLVVAAFYQYLENRRIRLKLLAGDRRPLPAPEIRTPLLRWGVAGGDNARLGVKFAEAVLFGVNSAIGYLLMLAIMSFNGGVFLAIVVGLTIGYFFFRNEGEDDALVVDNNSCAWICFPCNERWIGKRELLVETGHVNSDNHVVQENLVLLSTCPN